MQPAVRTSRLRRTFAGRTVVADLSLFVPQGGIYGFLGRNGAGKTTTIRMLLGLLQADEGTIELFGQRLLPANRGRLARQVGALVEVPPHYDHLTARENLAVTCRLRSLPAKEADRALDLVDLADVASRRVGGFSLGMRQRLGLARALLGRPRLLILDEPTNGLDPGGIIGMRALLRRLAIEDGITVLLSSHLLGEVEHVADHVGLIERGRLVAQGPITDLLSEDSATIELTAEPEAQAAELLRAANLRVEQAGAGRLLALPGPATPEPGTIARILIEGGCRLTALAERRVSLEDLFRRHTRFRQEKEAELC